MTSYNDVILGYLFRSFPWTKTTAATRFESVSRAVFGSKQRRLGPTLPPEDQVKIREVLRLADEQANGHADPGPWAEDLMPSVQFFVAWGSAKAQTGRGLDVLEVSAMKQLSCLQDELLAYGWNAKFTIRVEDLTGRYLRGDTQVRREMIDDYGRNLKRLAALVLKESEVKFESDCSVYSKFAVAAEGYQTVFENYLRSYKSPAWDRALEETGWTGGIPPEQLAYYQNLFAKQGYTGDAVTTQIAKSFAAVRARADVGAKLTPTGPFVQIAFTHPVPGNPPHHPRVYYRTIPERFTRLHSAPWLGRGYFLVKGDGDVTPQIDSGMTPGLTTNVTEWNGVRVETDYVVED